MPINQLSVNVSASNEKASSATRTARSITSTASIILDSNINRKGVLIQNTTGQDIYLGYDNTLTTSLYSLTIPNGSIYEMPEPIYTGDVYAVSASAVTPEVTEFS